MENENKLSKTTINIIRTTQRNNIELTSIADNKANVLLSLNGIMLTFLVPLILSNVDMVVNRSLYIPLIILGVTCFITIYLSATVLKPSNLDRFQDSTEGIPFSPFFFGNFYKMEMSEFYEYMKEALADNDMVRLHITQDLYYTGLRLSFKMNRMRYAFNLFIIGIFLTLLTTILVVAF